MKFSYYSQVTNGKLLEHVSKQIKNDLKAFEGKRVEIHIEKLRSKRSIVQNRAYWLYVGILSDELGYSKDELHEVIKFKFLKKENVFEKTGEIYGRLGSTTELSKSEFASFIGELIRWASSDLGIILPELGQQLDLL